MQALPLTKLKKGTKAKILEFSGGKAMAHKLSMLGLRPGASIIKLSSFALRGPVAVRVGHTTVALGHGMAEKIIVQASSEPVVKTS